jgi:hypothetical protein
MKQRLYLKYEKEINARMALSERLQSLKLGFKASDEIAVISDEENNNKYLLYLKKIIQLIGFNIEAIINTLETAKNFLVIVTSSFVQSSGIYISIL